MTVSFHDLRYFQAIAEHKSLSAASTAANISQPALSKCLRRLEQTFGGPLVRFTDGTLKLTAIGDVVLGKADRILFEIEDLRRQVAIVSDGAGGSVHFGTGPYAAEAACRHGVARFIDEHAHVQVRLVIAPWDELERLLRKEHLDFYLADIADVPLPPDLEIQELPPQPLRWFCRPNHPLCAVDPVRVLDLTRYPIAAPVPPTRFRKWLLEMKRDGAGPGQIGPEQPYSVACDNFAFLKYVVQQSNCVSALPVNALRDELADEKLVLLNVDYEAPPARIGVVRRRAAELSPSAAAILRTLIEEFTSTADG